MSKVEFNYQNNITSILCSEDELMEEICKKFGTKVQKDTKDLLFLYSGKQLNIQLKFHQVINNIDKERKIMPILVYDIYKENINRSSNIIKSVFPICSKCKENVKFNIDNYKINYICKNGHSNKILIEEYEKNQNIDISKIKCNNCNKNKSDTYNNEMYLCNTCKNILCPLCKNNHDKLHHIINYDNKNYICTNHNESYISYCDTCKINICIKCQKEHIKHNLTLFGEILPDKDKLLNQLMEFNNTISIFNNYIERTIDKLNNVKNNLEILYNIYNDMIDKYEDKYRNYEIFMSLDSINKNSIINELNNINTMTNDNDKIEKIINIYEKMNFDNNITIIYNIDKNEKIKIFGKKFVENNKDKCKIKFEDKIYDLTEEFNIKNINEIYQNGIYQMYQI